MAANLEKRGGKWHYRAVIGGKLYRRTTGFRVGTKHDLDAARRRASEIENDIRAGKFGWTKRDVPTFGAWRGKFLTAYYPDHYQERHLTQPAADRWGTRQLDQITTSDLHQHFREREAEGYANATLERERVVLNRLFAAAVRDKLIEDNPMTGIRQFRITARQRVLLQHQEVQIRALLPAHWDRYLTVALGTGLRAAEQRGARPMDLRHGGTWLYVRPECNKTRKSREVPLTPDVIKALRDQEASREGDETTSYWPYGESAFAHALQRACEKLNIEPALSPHDLRRTFGTRCAQRKVYPKHLQLIMGHADIGMTMKFYVALEQSDVRNALLEAVV